MISPALFQVAGSMGSTTPSGALDPLHTDAPLPPAAPAVPAIQNPPARAAAAIPVAILLSILAPQIAYSFAIIGMAVSSICSVEMRVKANLDPLSLVSAATGRAAPGPQRRLIERPFRECPYLPGCNTGRGHNGQ